MNLAQRTSFQRNIRWKDRLITLHFAWRDPATPLFAKCMIVFSVIYLVSPFDLIPDFIPVAGWLDDMIIVPFLLTLAERSLPPRVRDRARYKASTFSRQFQIVFWALIGSAVLFILAALYSWLK